MSCVTWIYTVCNYFRFIFYLSALRVKVSLMYSLLLSGPGTVGPAGTGGVSANGNSPDLVVLHMSDLRNPDNLPAIIRTLSTLSGVDPSSV